MMFSWYSHDQKEVSADLSVRRSTEIHRTADRYKIENGIVEGVEFELSTLHMNSIFNLWKIREIKNEFKSSQNLENFKI